MSVARSVARSVASPISESVVGSLSADGPLALSASATSVTEGTNVTFTFSGPSGRHLRKDGVWVWGGKNSPLTIRAGQLDAGTYTACYWDGATLVESSPVVLTVAASDLITDDFTSGSVAAGWTTSGTNTVTAQKLVVQTGKGYLEKSITGDKCRFVFEINSDNLTSGTCGCFSLKGSNGIDIVGGLLIYAGPGSFILRFTPNVAGHISGGTAALNYAPSTGYTSYALKAGSNKVEIYFNSTGREIEIYCNEVPHCIVRGIVDFGSGFTLQTPATFRIGNIDASTPGGSFSFDNVKLKTGNAALTPYALGSKWAAVHGLGQSNMAGAADGSYSSTTDTIGSYFAIGFGDDPGNGDLENLLVYDNANAYPGKATSTTIQFAFVQNIDLPANHIALLANHGVGSTSFSTNPGWAEDATGLWRTRAMQSAAQLAAVNNGNLANICIQFQGFEGDTAMSAPAYTALLAELISDYRTAIGDPACPVLIGGFSPAFLAGGENETAGYITIDDANKAYAEANNGAFASSMLPTPLTYQAGSPFWIHFDGVGYRGLGSREANEYLSINKAARPN